MNKLKTLISEDIEYSLKFIKKYNILSHIVGFFEAEYDYCLELQMQVLWTLSNMSSLDVDDIYMVEFINAHPKIINNLMRFLNSNNDSLLQNVNFYK